MEENITPTEKMISETEKLVRTGKRGKWTKYILVNGEWKRAFGQGGVQNDSPNLTKTRTYRVRKELDSFYSSHKNISQYLNELIELDKLHTEQFGHSILESTVAQMLKKLRDK